MQHTPGPWTVEEYGDDETPTLVIHKDSESRICFMAAPGSHGDPAKIEADAHLIAAAPDLLATLKKIAALRYVEDANEPFDEALDLAVAAIKKTQING
jgi:hypothetical protein